MCVELNQLRPVSSTEAGAGQPAGTVTAAGGDELVELGEALVAAGFEEEVEGLEVVVGALTDVLLVLVAHEEVAGALLDVEVTALVELVGLIEDIDALLEVVALAELIDDDVDEDDKHPIS